jgi:hypothetical protein
MKPQGHKCILVIQYFSILVEEGKTREWRTGREKRRGKEKEKGKVISMQLASRFGHHL